MNNAAIIGIIVVVIIVIIAAVALTSQQSAPATTTIPATTTEASSTTNTTTAQSTSTVSSNATSSYVTTTFSSVVYTRILMQEVDYHIIPNNLTVTTGETVTINIVNNGALQHNLVINGTSVNTPPINPGQNLTVTFTAPAAGTYTYYSSVGNDRSFGMVGTMKVV